MMGGGDFYAAVSSSSPDAVSSPTRSLSFPRSASPARGSSASRRVPDVRCLKPYIGPGRMAFPCGQCMSCRINRRRIWTHRLMLEQLQHVRSTFVTLTYAVEPDSGSLSPDHLKNWLKRLRNRVGPFRYFAVGEYGDSNWRPHYHAAVFGVSCDGGPIRRSNNSWSCQCFACDAVRRSWTFGHITLHPLERGSAQYIAGYVVKKLTKPDDPRLEGRYPEFARMSLKPGIGAGAIPDVASVVMQYKLDQRKGDVPNSLHHGSHPLPLGRYLMKRLRKECGLDEKAPEHVIEALRQGLLPVYDAAFLVAPGQGQAAVRKLIIQQAIEEENKQTANNLSSRLRINRRRL